MMSKTMTKTATAGSLEVMVFVYIIGMPECDTESLIIVFLCTVKRSQALIDSDRLSFTQKEYEKYFQISLYSKTCWFVMVPT